MVNMRAKKVEQIAQEIPPIEIDGASKGELLVVGWGSTFGAIKTAVERKQQQGKSVSRIHLRYVNPLPRDLEKVLRSFKKVLIPELNLGQLVKIIRANYLVPAISYSKVQGQPFMSSEIEQKIDELLGE
jgi:2-oxoglutarate ferredoxin oxidoreductase subunit alpha